MKRTITLEVTEHEARVLLTLIGGMFWSPVVTHVCQQLESALDQIAWPGRNNPPTDANPRANT